MTRLHIVVPLYKDVESFVLLHERVIRAVSSSGELIDGVAFVVVDDSAGADPEIERIRDRTAVTLVEPPFNLGHQRAIVVALRACAHQFADEDIVVTMDGDGQDKPEDVPRLIAPLLESDDRFLIALARRRARKESLAFKVLYTAFRLLFRFLTGREVRSGNFAAYRGAYAKTMLLHPSFDLCYSSSLITLNQDPVMIPCDRGDRYAGESRMGGERLLMHGVRMLMPFADRIAIRSLALCIATATLTFALLVVLAVGKWLREWTVSPGWSVLLVAGVVLAGLGLVNFLVLFTGFVQTSGLSLARLAEQVKVDDGTT
jgi:hypothetical protein